MHPANHPHELRHDRQYPPYGPQATPHADHVSHAPLWACAALLLVAFSALWAMSESPSNRWKRITTDADHPAQVATVSHLEPGESGQPIRPAPGQAREATAAEQTLNRRLADLEGQMNQTERLANKVGQQEAFATFERRHLSLLKDVSRRVNPRSEADCQRLDRETQVLIKDVSKFSNELEEVASVQL